MTATPTPRPPSVAIIRGWSSRFAFGLPAGSIRALLALGIVATAAGLTALHPDAQMPDGFRDLMFLILGSYFASRTPMDDATRESPPPLFLPAGTIRFLILLMFGAIIVVLARRPEFLRPRSNPALYPMIVVAGFLLGVLTSKTLGQLWKRGRHPKRLWADLRAVVALIAAIMLIVIAWDSSYHFLPLARENGPKFPITPDGIRHLLAAIVAFYFGARS